MTDSSEQDFPKTIDHAAVEEFCHKLWDETGIHRYDPNGPGELFSVDTPPPYVSAAHLHVGHAMSYAQAEFIVRYNRMNGRRVFYPMGFDDNGLPTERFVEKAFDINKRKTTRSKFRALCLDVTRQGAADYERLWRALGLSVDWTLRYSTIDDHSRRTAQKSFLELHRAGRIYRSSEPVLWDTRLETALAQADLETLTRKSTLHDIAFTAAGGADLAISTTRPELIPACVALYCHSTDERYRALIGTTAAVPLSGHIVPILADDEVDPAFGTGLMMVCTFGDGEDVRRWKRDHLETRLAIGPDGRMTPLAGSIAGLTTDDARRRILDDLRDAGAIRGGKAIEQAVSVSERSGAPIEFMMVPQWFIRVLDLKDDLLARSASLGWFPEWMRVRLDEWIKGLRYDWNISRQRFYGVPFPVWFCATCGHVIVAAETSLPIDPLEDGCPAARCEACGGDQFRGDPDVMDTWMTSSLTPLINSNWAGSPERAAGRIVDAALYPMTVRVQAFEIIRTWLFYTVVKSHLHTSSLPWREVMISGWGLNESGKKISKRDLDQFTTADGYNRYEPYAVIRKYGADALRYWAAGGSLGHDLRYSEKDVQAGHKLVLKIWNAARFCGSHFDGFDPVRDVVPFAWRTPEDRAMLIELNRMIPFAATALDRYSYHEAREAIDRFFWSVFCDDYVEMVKDRFWTPDLYPDLARESARITMWEALRAILALYAPFLPHVTEYLYQHLYREREGAVSLHVTPWPKFDRERTGEVPEMNVVSAILRAVRALRTTSRVSQTRRLARVVLDVDAATADLANLVRAMESSIRTAVRTARLDYGPAANPSELDGVRVDIEV